MSLRILVCMVEPVEVGYKFERSAWPLHITLVPWFEITDQSWFTSGLASLVSALKPIHLTLGDKELFGSRGNVPVNVVDPNKDLTKLHGELFRLVKEGGSLQSDRFVGNRYRAHVSHYGKKSLASGAELTMDNICIVELIDKSRCRVVAKYEL
jgi:2'-5' RNA ligase